MRQLSIMSLFAILVATPVLPAASQQPTASQPRASEEASPFFGTWKQNNDKSFYSEPYFATIRIESAGANRVRITQDVVRTTADAAAGKKENSVNEFTLDGS